MLPVNVSLGYAQVVARVPLYRSFTLEFDADLDVSEKWGEVLSHGLGLPAVWLYPKSNNRLWVCMLFRQGTCDYTVGLARRTCIFSRVFPESPLQRRVRISLSPAGSFELHENGELSSVAIVPHPPSSDGVSIPLYATSPYGYEPSSGRLSELRLTPHVLPTPRSPPPVPATQAFPGWDYGLGLGFGFGSSPNPTQVPGDAGAAGRQVVGLGAGAYLTAWRGGRRHRLAPLL